MKSWLAKTLEDIRLAYGGKNKIFLAGTVKHCGIPNEWECWQAKALKVCSNRKIVFGVVSWTAKLSEDLTHWPIENGTFLRTISKPITGRNKHTDRIKNFLRP